MKKHHCTECNGYCLDNDVLTAQNPFDPEKIIRGCPHCSAMNTLKLACDYLGCWKEATFIDLSGQESLYTCDQHIRGAT